MPLFVVHYSEVALKGNNRPEFLRSLRHNLTRALSDVHPKVSQRDGRLVLSAEGDAGLIEERLAKVFGVAWYSRVTPVARDYTAISGEVIRQAKAGAWPTFRISPHRSDKSFHLSSAQLATRLGSEVSLGTGMKVNLSDPALDIHVDVIRTEAMVYSNKKRGLGGLPVGTAGRVIHLFSGGIDSPVAAWLLMKRGCRPVYVHFYLAPTHDYPLNSKVAKLVKILSSFSGRSTLVLVPFAEYQLTASGVSAGVEPSLFRRFMRMTGELLAPKFGAGAISTGDALSQAASQTLWNLRVFDEGASLPILRPLLTYDKEDIVSLARRIGTYEASLEEYKDCCAIITRHPQTRAKGVAIRQLSEDLGFEGLISRSLEKGTLAAWDPNSGEMKVHPLMEALADRRAKNSGPMKGPRSPSPGALEAKI